MPTPLTIHLLGDPHLEGGPKPTYRFRSRKSWAILAYLLLTERPPSRSQLAELFFSQADDPLRALRWNLSEIRRALGSPNSISGDPVSLTLPAGTVVDTKVIAEGSLPQILQLPGLGATLLDGMFIRGAAAFESWLLSKQYQMASTTESALHEAALVAMSQGDFSAALNYAVQVSALSPFDENHHVLLIRIYRLAGDIDAARQQYMTWKATLEREFETSPGPAIEAAMAEQLATASSTSHPSSIAAIIESGLAAVSAGAVEAGIGSLRLAISAADEAADASLRATARMGLAGTLIHSLRGHDEEGLAYLHEADTIATSHTDREISASAKAEIGYVAFLRARYDRAEQHLTDAMALVPDSASLLAKAKAYLGSVEDDRSNYQLSTTLLTEAVTLSQEAGEPRMEAYALSMLGRSSLLRGDTDSAADFLDSSIAVTTSENWLVFLPWPQALRGEVQRIRGDLAGASLHLHQAFARACQIGDPCWEGTAARGIALLAETQGETDKAFEILADARKRCNRLTDPYVWLEAYILDAQSTLGRTHGHPDTSLWVDSMREITSRTGMRELAVRALLHGAALGRDGDFTAAQLLAAEIDNPLLAELLDP